MSHPHPSARIRPRPAGPACAAAALAALLALGAGPAAAQGGTPDTVALVWTAPGDDGDVGTATVYELRRSTAPIDETNWGSATVVTGLPAPLPAGTRQRAVVRGLVPGTTYYFAIRSADEAGNWSALSNVMRWEWVYDTAPPAAPVGLTATALEGGGVRLDWSANGEPDLAGYVVYRALASGGPFTAITPSPVPGTSYTDTGVPTGAWAAWYQVAARDGSGNESARSATAAVALASGQGEWAVRAVFPNPSGPGRPVRFGLVVPPGGGVARLEIVNGAGQRVRRVDLGALPPGGSTVEWDGRNDAGREVAPGAYTAWLIAGRVQVPARLVRMP